MRGSSHARLNHTKLKPREAPVLRAPSSFFSPRASRLTLRSSRAKVTAEHQALYPVVTVGTSISAVSAAAEHQALCPYPAIDGLGKEASRPPGVKLFAYASPSTIWAKRLA